MNVCVCKSTYTYAYESHCQLNWASVNNFMAIITHTMQIIETFGKYNSICICFTTIIVWHNKTDTVSTSSGVKCVECGANKKPNLKPTITVNHFEG